MFLVLLVAFKKAVLCKVKIPISLKARLHDAFLHASDSYESKTHEFSTHESNRLGDAFLTHESLFS